MRTIKFLGFAVALATVAGSLQAQGNIQPGAFPGIDRLARIEAARVARQHQLQRMGVRPLGRVRGQQRAAFRQHVAQGRTVGGRFAPMGAGQGRFGPGQAHGRFVGARGFGGRQQALAGAGIRAGARAGFRAGVRAERIANATPAQKAFVEKFRAQRQAVRAKVMAGTITREQARQQMQAWVMEHRPKK
ncbi:MAG: hypothetical protein FJ363_00050 [Gemmatimonadetes bacterium]|nr:hypothetical protein [Gemmatimonadota bacterium]